MDISNIPKTFWYSASFCIVLLTISFVVIAWKSTSLTIEIANAKIGLSQAATRTEEVVNKQLRVAEELDEERNQLESLREEILQLASQVGSKPGREVAQPSDGEMLPTESFPPVTNEEFSRSVEELKQKLSRSRLKNQKEILEEISKELDMTQMQIQQIKK